MLNQSFDLLNDLKSYSIKKIDFKIPLKNTYFNFVTGEIIQNTCTGGKRFVFCHVNIRICKLQQSDMKLS